MTFDVDKGLDAVRGLLTNRVGGAKVAKEGKISVENNPGRELRLDLPSNGVARVRVIIANSTIYMLEASGSTAFADSADTSKFFDSFTLQSKSAKEEKTQENSSDKVVTILNQKCARCHTGQRAQGKPPYQLFTGPGVLNPNAAMDRLLEVLESGKMPPQKPGMNNPRLTDEETTILQKWAQSKH